MSSYFLKQRNNMEIVNIKHSFCNAIEQYFLKLLNFGTYILIIATCEIKDNIKFLLQWEISAIFSR